MALAYDYSYQEWLKTHPKPVPIKVAPKAPVKALRAEITKAQKRPEDIRERFKKWSPQLPFRDRKSWRAWMRSNRLIERR